MSDDRQTPRRQSLRPAANGQGGATGPARPSPGVNRVGAATTAASSPKKGKGGGSGEPPKPAWKVWTKRIGIGALVAGLVTFTVALVGLAIAYARLEVPEAADVALYQQSTVYYADGVTEMGSLGTAEREIIDYDEMPQTVKDAIVASEDRTFWENPGVDITGTIRALYKTVVQGNKQGGSTITQQYVERYYKGETVTDIPGKINEALLALKVGATLTKEEVLENYLNTIYFGRGAYGIQTAAQAYFGKDAADLTVSEAALLVGVVPAPSAWDPRVNEAQAEYRWNYVLDSMVITGALTQEERDDQVFPEVIEYTQDNVYAGTTGYLIRAALDEVIADTDLELEDIETLGLSIVTTIEETHQEAAVAAVENMPEDHDEGLTVAAVTVDSSTGAITSMYGGSDYLERQQNSVTQDIVQAGSTFKPFALITGLEQGISLETEYLSNSGMTFGDYGPVKNFGNVNYGWIDLIKATQSSVNTAFVQLGLEVGNDNVMETAIEAGIPEDTPGLDANPSNVLGPSSPHPVDIAEAYATISSGGVHHDTYMVQTVKDREGSTTYEHDSTDRRVFAEDVIADTTYAMQQVVLYGSGKTASSLGRDIAGKTGTSNDNKSALFAAFTPQIVGVVALYQIGEDGSSESITPFGGYSQITGSSVPTDIWTDMMGTILEEYPDEDFPERADVGEATQTAPSPSATPSSTPTPTPEATETTDPTPEPTETTDPTPEPTETTEPPVTTPTPDASPQPTIQVTVDP